MGEQRDSNELFRSIATWLRILQEQMQVNGATTDTIAIQGITKDREDLQAIIDTSSVQKNLLINDMTILTLSDLAFNGLTRLMEDESLNRTQDIELADVEAAEFFLKLKKAIAIGADNVIIKMNYTERHKERLRNRQQEYTIDGDEEADESD
jgi:hypothetical protein